MAETLADMYRRGMSVTDIAHAERIPAETVRGVLIDSGVTILKAHQRGKAPPVPHAVIAAEIDRGMKVSGVMRRYGLTYAQVNRIMRSSLFAQRRKLQDDAQVAREYLGGKSVRTLARFHKVSIACICRALKRQGVQFHGRREGVVDREHVWEDYRNGYRIEEIQHRHGCTRSWVHQILKEKKDALSAQNVCEGAEVRSDANHTSSATLGGGHHSSPQAHQKAD